MSDYIFVNLRSVPQLKEEASRWFCEKWGVPQSAYLECMENYLANKTQYGWYVCLHDDKIVGGLGVIENDFHKRKDLAPNVCAVFTEESHRGNGIAGYLLNMAVVDLKNVGISPVYLLTDHIGFYERYGWQFLCMVDNEDGQTTSRMYVHY